jgi:hypothetical protein
MINTRMARPLCMLMVFIMSSPCVFGQIAAPSATPPPTPAAPRSPGQPLSITVLEGNNSVNSLSSLRSVAPVVEVRDANDFPVEGAQVVFTLPEHGPGGTFAQGGASFSARSDSSGQATAPLIVPSMPGKFVIRVTATLGDRKGEAVVSQTNSSAGYSGPAIPPRPWYRRRKVLAIIGGAAAAGIILALVTGGSSSSSAVSITPGAPVFH